MAAQAGHPCSAGDAAAATVGLVRADSGAAVAASGLARGTACAVCAGPPTRARLTANAAIGAVIALKV